MNTYKFYEDYVIGYTKKQSIFYIDLEDYDKIKNYNWIKHSNGMITKLDKSTLSMTVLILGQGRYKHLDGNKFNNRKNNLSNFRQNTTTSKRSVSGE